MLIKKSVLVFSDAAVYRVTFTRKTVKNGSLEKELKDKNISAEHSVFLLCGNTRFVEKVMTAAQAAGFHHSGEYVFIQVFDHTCELESHLRLSKAER